MITVYFAFLVQLITYAHPRYAKLVARGWLLLGGILGTINTYIILTVLYLVILTPISFIYRFFSKDKHGMRRAPSETNFLSIDKLFGPDSLDKMW